MEKQSVDKIFTSVDASGEDPKSVFFYAAINRCLVIRCNRFMSILRPFDNESSDYIFFTYNYQQVDKNKQTGWKFHISFDDTIEENVGRGWDIVKDILIMHQISVSKVIRAEKFKMNGTSQQGKHITIYAFHNLKKDWAVILHEIEKALVAANITSGPIAHSDKPVSGSQFISYRNDGKIDGSYLSAKEAVKFETSYNPYNYPEPFPKLHININVDPKKIMLSVYNVMSSFN